MIIRLRALAKDGTLAAFASAKPGRPASAEALELELLRGENERFSEAIKELAVELTLHRGGQRLYHEREMCCGVRFRGLT